MDSAILELRRTRAVSLLVPLFVLSGATSLVYETLWERQLHLVMGTSQISVITVLTAFMAGLAAGGFLAGRHADKVRRPLLAYALLEGGIGLYALLFPFLLQALVPVYTSLYAAMGGDNPLLFAVIQFVLVGFFLLPPTICMGATLPLLARFAASTKGEAGQQIGRLYGANTIGAVCGVGLAGFVLLPNIGLQATTGVTAAANVALCLMAAVLNMGTGLLDSGPAKPETPTEKRSDGGWAWILPPLALLAGTATLVYEVSWFRVLGLILGGSAYAFSTMLLAFLLGIGSGGWLGGFAADAAWKRGGVAGGLALLAGLQVGVGLLAYAVMWQYNELPFIFVELYEWFFNSGLDYGWLWVGKLCLAITLMLPPCLLMGATFPAMVRVASSDSALGATTGRIYGWNTVGSILGASLGGLVLLPTFHVRGTVVIAISMNLIAAGLALWAVGRAPSLGATFTLPGATDVELTLEAASGLQLSIEDAGGSSLPGVVDVRWAAGQPPVSDIPAGFHEALGQRGGSRAMWGWTGTGTLDAPLAPGTYTVRVGHSWRHGQDVLTDVVVAPGAVTEVTATLPEVVLRDGWLSLDTHLHAAPSFDGALSMEHRLVTCAATGLDLPVMTDHDRQVDYAPLADAMGLSARMQVLPGVEVTSLLRGHFNLFPVTPDPSLPNGGAEPWWDTPRDTQELFDRMRARAGDQAITQINHPRTPGMFSLSRFEAQTAEPLSPELFSWDFDIFELLNGGVDNLPQVRDDLFAMLSVGRRKIPVGSSDSHYAYIPCGHGRTDVWLDSDDPSAVTVDAVREAVLAGHVIVAGGTTLRASLDTGSGAVLPGETTTGANGTLAISVRAPDWIAPGTLKVWRNWEVVFEQELTAATDAVWFDEDVPIEVTEDAWITVEVEGSESIGPLWRDFTAYAMTNAFFVDVDGDGWEPPGLGDRR